MGNTDFIYSIISKLYIEGDKVWMNPFGNSKFNVMNLLPGIGLSFLLAFVANLIEDILPIDFIGASVIALFLGILFNYLRPIQDTNVESGVAFSSKRILKFAIILLGASLNIQTILAVGKISLLVMVFTLLAAFGGGYLLGKLLGLDWKLSSLISSGTGICGGSAIAAVSPVIEAEDHQISYAMSTTFIFDMLMIVLFPLAGKWLGMSDIAYGLWTGTAVNDTSSVVAAGYAFSEAAGDFATMVKLTRTLSIIPTVIAFTFIQILLSRKKSSTGTVDQQTADLNIKDLFPWFILGFLAMAFLHSVGIISVSASLSFKAISKFLMVVALAAIGLKTDFHEMKQSGFAPMLHGFLISLLVVIVSLIVQHALGIV